MNGRNLIQAAQRKTVAGIDTVLSFLRDRGHNVDNLQQVVHHHNGADCLEEAGQLLAAAQMFAKHEAEQAAKLTVTDGAPAASPS